MTSSHRKRTSARPDTLLAHLGRSHQASGGRPVNPPVYHASTVLFQGLEEYRQAATRRGEPGFVYYGRAGTLTQYNFEDAVAELEGGAGAVSLPSGLAAIAVAILAFAKAGDHVLVADTVYAPTRALCRGFLDRFGVTAEFYDPNLGAQIADLFRPETRLVFLESPGSLTFEVQDVPAIAEAARRAGVLTVADNTWATPLFFRPLDKGVDVSIHAGTKYLVGHSDAMVGIAVAGEPEQAAVLRKQAMQLGYHCAPDDAYLALRGLRTLSVRLARHQQTALRLAEWLGSRPEVARVLYPALPGDPGHALWRRDFTGASGLFGFELQPVDDAAVAAFTDELEYFGMGASWGGYESLIIPADPAPHRSAVPWRDHGPLLRVHAGLEDPDDLIEDLAAGFERLKRAAGKG